ncbi:MAG TPA: CDP-diacylglycerol--glycerol-3-phosphate 3-phosphatidyltransferase [Vicinamibacteria bacterium]|nr:CDP-diacylglycerol--glycerol-3-phosphate 3-phosphatidyltransferase [Vicinamibacteria bacterium]
MNLPNALTALRIFLVPVLVVVLLTRARTPAGLFLGTAIFGIAVLTDYLDGYFARRRNQVTRLGIILDPIADKLLTAAAFLSLIEMDAVPVPAWMVMIILGRELAVTGLRNVAAGWGHLIPASGLGKGKMVAQVVAIFLLLLAQEFAILYAPAMAALWAVVVLAVVSGVDYFRSFWLGVYRNPPRPEEEPAPEGPAVSDPALATGGRATPQGTGAASAAGHVPLAHRR